MHLTKLKIHTNYDNVNDVELKWPHLPVLKKLCLTGVCFRTVFLNIAQNSPKIRKFEFEIGNTDHSYDIDFHPLIVILGKNLTHLRLPGEGTGPASPQEVQVLIADIIEHCRNLQVLYLKSTFFKIN